MSGQFLTGLYVGIGSSWFFACIVCAVAYFLRGQGENVAYERGKIFGKLELQREQMEDAEFRRREALARAEGKL